MLEIINKVKELNNDIKDTDIIQISLSGRDEKPQILVRPELMLSWDDYNMRKWESDTVDFYLYTESDGVIFESFATKEQVREGLDASPLPS